jgi:hypothetical protein
VGFASVGALAAAASDDGKCWVTGYRKLTTAVTIAGQWFDFSYAAGNPVANYYASVPLTSATVDADRGIYHGPSVSPAQKYIHRAVLVNGAASNTATTSQNLTVTWLDYLLYYPFIDMDAAGEQQDMFNTVTLPRYTTGAGIRMMMVALGQTTGSGLFTVTYTNQDGTPDRVTPAHYCVAAQPAGALVSASATAVAGVSPFLALASGDTGVRSVQSVTFSVANGGLAAIALVRPLLTFAAFEESRRTSTGTLESFGSPSETEAMRTRAGTGEQILDGAVLGFIGHTAGGSVASAQMVGLLETVWS